MGHERLGALPHTQRWQAIIEKIAESHAGVGNLSVPDLAEATLDNVQERFLRIHTDSGVQAAFAYLVSLATASLPSSTGLSTPGTSLVANPSPVRIVKNLCDWVREHCESSEYAEIACRAGADTVAEWTRRQSEQGHLFEGNADAAQIWRESSNGAGFCQVARTFFARFTERYLRYFLERHASSQLPSVAARDEFAQNLHNHVDEVSHHAFETAKITQSFAAGWFNKHAHERRPSDREIEAFLAVAFGKLREELRRETPR
jgi:hypothetical protein